MLIRPKNALPPTRSTTGIVRGRSSAGYWVRARASVVNPNTPAMSRWRNLFGAAKMNYKAAVAGTNPPLVGSTVSALDAWTIFAETYFGILAAGVYYGGLQFPSTLTGCSTVDAFTVMVGTTLNQLELPIPPVPTTTNSAISSSSSDATQSSGGWNAALLFPVYANLDPLTLPISLSATSPSGYLPTPPGGNTIDGLTLAPIAPIVALFQGGSSAQTIRLYTGEAYSGPNVTGTLAASSLPTGLTASILQAAGPIYTSIGPLYSPQITLTASATLAPGNYTITLTLTTNIGTFIGYLTVAIYSESAPPFSVTVTGLPAGVTAVTAGTTVNAGSGAGLGTLTVGQSIKLTLAPNSAAASTTATSTIVTTGPTFNFPFNVTIGIISPVAAPPAPFFQTPTYLSAHPVYDDTMTVEAIALEYDVPDTGNGVMQRYGAAIHGQWIVTASPAYTSSYAQPDPSSWAPITYNGSVETNTTAFFTAPGNTPDDILSAWEEVFGELPDSGKIKFQVQPVDPVTGCPGPALSCTFEWENGTLLGAIIGEEGIETPGGGTAWWGPAFFIDSVGSPITIVLGTPYPVGIGVSGDRGYTGTVTFAVKSKSPVPNGNNSTTSAIPPGLTFTFDPPTIDIVADYPTTYTTTLTITADPATAPFWSGNIDIEASDGIQTAAARTLLQVNGHMILPASNFLTITPANSGLTVPSGESAAALLTLANTGPDPIGADMLSGSVNPNLSAEFGTGAVAAATATPTSITFALATGAPNNSLIGQTLSSAGYSPAGYNVTDANIIANDGTTITVTSTNAPGAMTTAGVAAIINSTVTVPPATPYGPSPASVTWSADTAIFSDPWSSPPGSLVGLRLNATGYTPSGYNSPSFPIVANDGTTITVTNSPNPGPMTGEGSISVSVPSSINIYIFVSALPGNEIEIAFLQVEASAGLNLAYAAISVTSQASGAVEMTPFVAPPITTVLTPWVISFTVTNTDAGDITLALATLNPSPLFALTFSGATVYVPGGSPASPGTATFSVTATIETAHTPGSTAILITASAPGITLLGTIPVIIT